MKIKIKRLVAVYLDFVFIFAACYFPFYYLQQIFSNWLVTLFLTVVVFVLIFNLFLRKDCLIGYESVGKKIMNLKIYKNDIRIENKKLLMDRVLNTMGSFCFYPFMILIWNKSSGDNKYETEVK